MCDTCRMPPTESAVLIKRRAASSKQQMRKWHRLCRRLRQQFLLALSRQPCVKRAVKSVSVAQEKSVQVNCEICSNCEFWWPLYQYITRKIAGLRRSTLRALAAEASILVLHLRLERVINTQRCHLILLPPPNLLNPGVGGVVMETLSQKEIVFACVYSI